VVEQVNNLFHGEYFVEHVATSGKKWTLTEGALAKFLRCLADGPEEAGEKYEAIRLLLVKFFDWRGAHFPEECADETINRVIRKIEAGEAFRDLPAYCLGVARMVHLEALRGPDHRRVDFEELPPIAAPPAPEEDDKEACFTRCLHELPIESRQLVLCYYQDERRDKINNRQTMADRRGIPLNALRSRVQRIRNRLEQCIEQCLERQAGKK
jgi:DNA-directed RNA polymerase specialized sigma24 family protein